ncbi:MAG: type V toxin-antitoxin system endoribonuclease antitoxin GhoS [Bryobacteraceae bacterium]
MAKYTVRMELYGTAPDTTPYRLLHRAMEGNGFTRTIQSSDGLIYRLPTAEYNFEGDVSGEEVRALAKDAASQTGRHFGVLVTRAGARWWSGLEE